MERQQNIRQASLRQVVADNHSLSGLKIIQQFGGGGEVVLAGGPDLCPACGSEKAPGISCSCGN
jgi:hypothetical protein